MRLKELAKECGVELEDTASLEAIEEKLNTFAEVRVVKAEMQLLAF